MMTGLELTACGNWGEGMLREGTVRRNCHSALWGLPAGTHKAAGHHCSLPPHSLIPCAMQRRRSVALTQKWRGRKCSFFP